MIALILPVLSVINYIIACISIIAIIIFVVNPKAIFNLELTTHGMVCLCIFALVLRWIEPFLWLAVIK